tara:strand:+ start:474 stop:659 length:186 start_codon:yes stop_codon:yes gene_type:complete
MAAQKTPKNERKRREESILDDEQLQQKERRKKHRRGERRGVRIVARTDALERESESFITDF